MATILPNDDLSAGTVQAGLRTRYVGRGGYKHLRTIDSTQNLTRDEAVRGAAEGLVVAADEQTQGRGRLQRTWVSPLGGSLHVSILLRPPEEMLPHVVMAAAVATVRAIEAVVPEVRPVLKWPNDVLIEGRKVCGMLVETVFGPRGPEFVVLGIGVNVNWDPSIIPEIRETATSLMREAGYPVSRRALLLRLLEELETAYEQAKTDSGVVFQHWRQRLATLGQRVQVQWGDVSGQGMAEDVDPSGSLLLRLDTGELKVVTAGDVQRLR